MSDRCHTLVHQSKNDWRIMQLPLYDSAVDSWMQCTVLCSIGVITPNQIPLTTIVTYLQKSYRSRISNHWATLYLHAVWYLPFTKSPRKHTVTYHFSDLQEVYSGNRQIRTKCHLQYFHPPHISTSGKCHCVIIHQTTKATECIG